jgi:uncharacterized protein
MRAWFEWITDHPRLVIFLCLLSTSVFGYGLTKIQAEADVKNMLPKGYPSVSHIDRIDDVFGVEQSVAIAIVNESPEGIYNRHTLDLIDALGKKLTDIKGIDPEKIWSIFTVSDIVGDEGGFSVVPLAEQVPQSDEEVAALKARLTDHRMYSGSLVSKNGQGTLINAEVTPVADNGQVYFDVMALLETIKTDGEQFFVSGGPVVQGVIGIHVGEDMSKMMPLTSVVIVLMLLLIFRTVRGVALPLLVVMFSVIWAMGLMAFLKIPLYPMTTIVPIVVMAIGVADGIHILARYNEAARENPGRSSKEIAVEAMCEMWSPVVMTSLTTTVGFLSLLTSSMRPIFHTGIFTSVGVMAAMIFSMTFIPAALALMRPPKQKAMKAGPADRFFDRFGEMVHHKQKAVLAVTAIIVTASLVGLWFVNVDSDPMANFNQEDPIPISTKVINRLFSGAMVLHTTLESETEKRFLDPEVLTSVDRYQTEVEKLHDVGATLSVVDFLKMMHRAMNEDDPAYEKVPDRRNLVGTYLLLYSGDNINHYINYGRDFINVRTQVATSSTRSLQDVMEKMELLADEHLRSHSDVKVIVGGIGRVVVDMINIIVYGQIWSILLSIFGVFVITSIMFRSVMAGLLNIVPISVATGANFGLMGLTGIPLEPATAITSCIGIGVGIDYAIHFIAKYRLNRRKMSPGAELTRRTMSTAGKAIFFNALVVIGGFLMLLASQFPPSRHMGVMVSLNMFTSFAAALTALAALLAILDPKFCRKASSEEKPK